MSGEKCWPKSWLDVSIKEVLETLDDGRRLHHGWSPQCEKVPALSNEEWGVLKTTAIQDGLFLSEHNKKLPIAIEPRRNLEVKQGDILLTCAGPRNRCGVPCLVRSTRPRLLLSGKMYRFRVLAELVDATYMEGFLRSKESQEKIDRMKTGISDSGLNLTHDRFLRLTIPLPPLNEQRRIVAKIEELFSDLDAGVAALKRAQAKLKRYRAAVLKAAVEGKLTEEWRAEHPATETGQELLTRILQERRQKWEADQLAKFAAAGKEPPKNWKEKYVEPTPPDTAGLPPIPTSWTWSSLESVANLVGGVAKDQKKMSQTGLREVPYLRVANVQRGFLDLSEVKTIMATEQDIAELRLEVGDVLFNEGGDRDKLGRGWVWAGEIDECIHQNHVFRCRLSSLGIQPRFISHHGNTFGKDWFIKAGKQTTNLASISLGVLRRFPVPVPPSSEQSVIVEMVDEKLSQIDAAENQLEHALQRAARLRQSILKKAFEGKLVPQDPNDEPASVLLERLRLSEAVDDRSPNAASPGRSKGRRRNTQKVTELSAGRSRTSHEQ